jgi:DNA replication protein DnaC
MLPEDTPKIQKSSKPKIKVDGLTKKFKDVYLDIKETSPIKTLKKNDDFNILYLWGERGNGKSISVQWYLCKKYLEGSSCRYITMSRIIMDLYSLDFPQKVKYIDSLINYDILAIDEIDKIKLTEYKEEMIFYLLDERINNEKQTITIGNSDIKRLENKLQENIVSRVLSGLIIENTGELLR